MHSTDSKPSPINPRFSTNPNEAPPTKSEAAKICRQLFGMFASLSIRDPETFAAAVVAAMLRFPKSAVEMMADPVEGLAAKTDNLTLSAVVGYLKADFSWRLRISNNARLSGGPETCRRLIAIDGRVPPMLDDDKSNIRPTMVDLKARYGDTFGLNAMLDPVPDKTIHMKGSNHD